MSDRTHRRHGHDHHLCAECHERRAKYRYQGHIRADRQHVLCFSCFRCARERMRASQLARMPVPRPAPFRYELTDSQLEHRRRMLAHLQTRAASVGQ